MLTDKCKISTFTIITFKFIPDCESESFLYMHIIKLH